MLLKDDAWRVGPLDLIQKALNSLQPRHGMSLSVLENCHRTSI